MTFGNWLWPSKAAPASLGDLSEFEDHGECRLVRKTSLGTHRAVANRGERAFETRFNNGPNWPHAWALASSSLFSICDGLRAPSRDALWLRDHKDTLAGKQPRCSFMTTLSPTACGGLLF
jgi:hypothetical protein